MNARTRSRATHALPIALSILAAACSSAAPGRLESSPTPVAETARRAELLVDSRYPGPVIVYAVTHGLRQRLGTVTAFRSVRLVLPPDLLRRGRVVHLLARPLGERTEVVTEAFDVEGGDRVRWTLLWPLEGSIATLHVELGS